MVKIKQNVALKWPGTLQPVYHIASVNPHQEVSEVYIDQLLYNWRATRQAKYNGHKEKKTKSMQC